MDQRQILRGTTLYFGAPASPMSAERAARITDAVTQISGIAEAHLPQCLIGGDVSPRQVLVIGVASQPDIPRIIRELEQRLNGALPDGDYIDILPFTIPKLFPGVREARCQIFPVTNKPWWKLW